MQDVKEQVKGPGKRQHRNESQIVHIQNLCHKGKCPLRTSHIDETTKAEVQDTETYLENFVKQYQNYFPRFWKDKDIQAYEPLKTQNRLDNWKCAVSYYYENAASIKTERRRLQKARSKSLVKAKLSESQLSCQPKVSSQETVRL